MTPPCSACLFLLKKREAIKEISSEVLVFVSKCEINGQNTEGSPVHETLYFFNKIKRQSAVPQVHLSSHSRKARLSSFKKQVFVTLKFVWHKQNVPRFNSAARFVLPKNQTLKTKNYRNILKQSLMSILRGFGSRFIVTETSCEPPVRLPKPPIGKS